MTRDEEWLLEEKYGGITTAEFEADRERLASGEPLGYVIGFQPFLGLKISLDSKPLIPRVETEWWTDQLLSHVGRSTSYMGFLDLCAGSGAIGCAALARLPQAEVYFGELDPAHEATILKNIRQNGLDESRAHVSIGDLFEPFGDTTFAVIAVNPPYIPSEREIAQSVALYEPPLALYGGTDGLEVIRRIASELPKHLAKGGVAWIECDSAHAREACALFASEGLHAEIRTDQYSQPRILVVSFP